MMAQQIHAWTAACGSGALSTVFEGAPFASLVNVAQDHDGVMLMYLSDLAVHTQGLRADARCALLLSDAAAADPQASWRVTLVGSAHVDDARTSTYIKRHPTTSVLGGFHCWRLDVTRTRYIAGFGHMGWL